MDEHFLHYIWKHQRFSHPHLKLTSGTPVAIFHTGFHNHNSGPDFEEARVKIEKVEWAGSVEIHLRSSDWNKHRHTHDPAYDKVILHVVWEHDQEILVSGAPLPTLALSEWVDPLLLQKYQKHMQSEQAILCSPQLAKVPSIEYESMLASTLVSRLEAKASRLHDRLSQNKNNWEATVYHTLASNFGFSINKIAFERLAYVLPFEILKKNLSELHKTEALLFGQAGFLAHCEDDYQSELQATYHFLKEKFKLRATMAKSEWKFGRMRPANFPVLRIAQFASLLHQNPTMFDKILAAKETASLFGLFKITLSAYWTAHYDFGKKRSAPSKGPGTATLENLLINSASPLLAAYSRHMGDQAYMDRALALLESIQPEANRYTKEWSLLGKKARSAFESQAQIELLRSYCLKKRCLECNIGASLIRT